MSCRHEIESPRCRYRCRSTCMTRVSCGLLQLVCCLALAPLPLSDSTLAPLTQIDSTAAPLVLHDAAASVLHDAAASALHDAVASAPAVASPLLSRSGAETSQAVRARKEWRQGKGREGSCRLSRVESSQLHRSRPSRADPSLKPSRLQHTAMSRLQRGMSCMHTLMIRCTRIDCGARDRCCDIDAAESFDWNFSFELSSSRLRERSLKASS